MGTLGSAEEAAHHLDIACTEPSDLPIIISLLLRELEIKLNLMLEARDDEGRVRKTVPVCAVFL